MIDVRRLLGGLLPVAALVLLTTNAVAEEPWQAEWTKVLTGARKEGAVVVSGPPGEIARGLIMSAWAKAFPDIALQYTAARGTQILSKVARERASGLYNWDVVLASTDPTVFTLIPIDALAPLRDAFIDPALASDDIWMLGFQAGFMDDAGKFLYSPTGKVGSTLGYVNRDCVSKETLSKVEDLKKPELTGKIAWYDPLQPGTGSRSTWVLTTRMGDAWLEDLFKGHDITFARDYRQITDWLVDCTKPVAIGITNDVLSEMQKHGIGVQVEGLTGQAYFHGLPQGWGGGNEDIGWYNDAPHPNAARIFVNWYLSRDFQQQYADANVTNSRRRDTKPGDPDTNDLLLPGVIYRCWANEESIRQLRALQQRIKSWGVLG
jgi:iron(III) transport system substrate-binding protein